MSKLDDVVLSIFNAGVHYAQTGGLRPGEGTAEGKEDIKHVFKELVGKNLDPLDFGELTGPKGVRGISQLVAACLLVANGEKADLRQKVDKL